MSILRKHFSKYRLIKEFQRVTDCSVLLWDVVSRIRTKGALVLKFILKPLASLTSMVRVEEAKTKLL